MQIVAIIDLLLTLAVLWLLINIAHAFLSGDQEQIKNVFFSISNWLRKKKK